MARKIPTDAFQVYLGLGTGRSYQAVANRFGVAKRSVTKLASREKWQQRLEEIEAKARQEAEQKAANSLANLTDRHLRTVRILGAKALQALKEMPIRSAGEAAKMLDISLRQERQLLGLEGPSTVESRNSELDTFKKKLTEGLVGWEINMLHGRDTIELQSSNYRLTWFRRKFLNDHPGISLEEYASKDRRRELIDALMEEEESTRQKNAKGENVTPGYRLSPSSTITK